jgi:glycosyltransferase involved in cell wall biosynthesis
VNQHPLVSIVTPTYNMAGFLEETIQSVLSQDYPNIEYIVMDGGSTDGTLDILRRYEGRLAWVSEKDEGQADAINKGFLRSHGEIFAYLNADDTYLPGAVSAAVRNFLAEPDVAVVYGEAYYTRQDGSIFRRYPTDPFDVKRLNSLCYICQPAAFVRSAVFREVGMLDPTLHLTLDYDLWLRIAKRHRMKKIDAYLATSRMHPANKTLSRREDSFREIIQITKRHCGYVPLNWLYGYAGWILDGKDGFYDPSPASLRKALRTIWLAVKHNPFKLHRFAWECVRSAGLALRLLSGLQQPAEGDPRGR